MTHADPNAAPETAIRRRDVYQGRVVDLHVDDVRLADGSESVREVVEHRDAVVIIPIDSGGNVALVRQFRYPVGRSLLEAPAGGVDPGESYEEAAQRELQEEIGYRAGRLERLGAFWSAPGFCTERLHAFLARDLAPSKLAADDDERIEVEWSDLPALAELIRTGGVADAKTIAAFHLALARLG